MKKILTILLIIALALFAFSISGSPLVIIVGELAVMTSVKNFKKSGEGNSESAESKQNANSNQFFKDESGEMSWKNAILWGDMGIANFFISHSDLKMRDFSNVLYNWDCC